MHWQFWQSSAPERIPEIVRKALVSQFHLDPQAIDQLRMLKKAGQFAGRPVRFIQIFDPGLVNQAVPSQVRYGQLESGEMRSALLFGGHIEKTGQVYLSDQRRSKAPVPTS